MGFKPTKQSKPKVLPPEGTHPARLIWLIDLGTQMVKGYKGAPDEEKQQVHLFFEMPTITHVFDEAKGPQPFGISNTFTYSLDEKANLSKFLEQWFERKLTDKERAEGYDLSTLVDKTCLLTIAYNKGKDEKTYANIARIEKNAEVKVGNEVIKKKFNVPPAVNPLIKFSLDESGWATEMEKMPKWLQEKVKKSAEWRNLGAPQGAQAGSAEAPTDESDEF